MLPPKGSDQAETRGVTVEAAAASSDWSGLCDAGVESEAQRAQCQYPLSKGIFTQATDHKLRTAT